MTDINWSDMWVPSLSLLEMFVRGSVVYLALFLYFRLLRREAGGLGITDVLVVVLVADAIQNAMANEYKSITEGLVLVGTIGFWDYLLDWLGYHSATVGRLLRPPPLLLIRNGALMRQNMKKEMITEEELLSQLREQGIEDPRDVRKCYLEGDGRLSVIPGGSRSQGRGVAG
ncbi:MAG TPA: YetF domain-containing protein [Burkholderiales bacterium]|jgi:uncharacterized membrane protein YcaP (DUF421 family)|nr:YetF domain-containing protein [Burkholderiales bacterium]